MRRRSFLKCMSLVAAAGATGGCQFAQAEPLRLTLHPWPGYEMIYLAKHTGAVADDMLQLMDSPSASASIRALRSRVVDAACLTLDEVLQTRAEGLPLTVVTVLNVSLGADVVMAGPQINSLEDLRGRTIGVEHTATGAVMLEAAIGKADLPLDQLRIRYVPADAHFATAAADRVDAIVTYEPTSSRLRDLGWIELFSSRDIPERIVDVLVVRTEMLEPFAPHLGSVVEAHFRTLASWQAAPDEYAPLLAKRLKVKADRIQSVFADVGLLSVAANRQWFADDAKRLVSVARGLGDSMMSVGLLASPPDLTDLGTGRFLPS